MSLAFGKPGLKMLSWGTLSEANSRAAFTTAPVILFFKTAPSMEPQGNRSLLWVVRNLQQ